MFLSLYLDALDEELVALRSSFNTHIPASTLKGEGLEEENQLGKGQIEVGERGCTVRQLFFLFLPNMASPTHFMHGHE